MRTTDLEESIKRMLASSRDRNEFDGVLRQLSCRINIVRHYQIGLLADRLNMTRAGLAEHLLDQATEIAWSAAGLGELTQGDMDAIRALTNTLEVPRQQSGESPSAGSHRHATSHIRKRSETDQLDNDEQAPNRLPCINAIFRHVGAEIGKIKGTIGASKDGSVRVCCLVSKDYEVQSASPGGERYWFTIYARQLHDINRAEHPYVAFACGSPDQIVLFPAIEFGALCKDLPPYTQGHTGWHVRLSKVDNAWKLRHKGVGSLPSDVTRYVL